MQTTDQESGAASAFMVSYHMIDYFYVIGDSAEGPAVLDVGPFWVSRDKYWSAWFRLIQH